MASQVTGCREAVERLSRQKTRPRRETETVTREHRQKRKQKKDFYLDRDFLRNVVQAETSHGLWRKRSPSPTAAPRPPSLRRFLQSAELLLYPEAPHLPDTFPSRRTTIVMGKRLRVVDVAECCPASGFVQLLQGCTAALVQQIEHDPAFGSVAGLVLLHNMFPLADTPIAILAYGRGVVKAWDWQEKRPPRLKILPETRLASGQAEYGCPLSARYGSIRFLQKEFGHNISEAKR